MALKFLLWSAGWFIAIAITFWFVPKILPISEVHWLYFEIVPALIMAIRTAEYDDFKKLIKLKKKDCYEKPSI